jgi:uncharacterized phosphosugar-binding protein
MRYFAEVRKVLDWAEETQAEVIGRVADLMAEAISSDRMVYVFGCSHASILAAETFYRAGGLAAISPIFAPGLTVDVRPMDRTTRLERLPGFASLILADVPLGAGDVFLVISVSGRNTVPVEMAMEGKAHGATVVAVTSVSYSQTVTSRHPSGQRLFEVADHVIDLGGVPGDAIVTFDGLAQAVGPSSTVVGAALLNALVCETVERLLATGETPPIFLSANLDGGDEHNAALLARYRGKVTYL